MVSDAFKEHAYAPESDEVWLVLLTISHDDLTDDIRVVNNNEDIFSNGETYYACPFEPVLPSSSDEGPPAARLRVDNINQDIVKAIREVESHVSLRFDVIVADDPDTIEQTYSGFALADATATVGEVTGTLTLDDLRLEAYPARSFSPQYFSGIF